METVALLYEDYQKELAKDFKNTFLKRASDTDSSRSNDTVIDEVTDMLSTNIAVYTEKLLQRWGFSSGGEGGGGGDVTVTLDDLLKKYLSDNYVTIKGDQEVFGEKDFRKGIRIAGRRLYWDEGNDALVIEGAAYTTRWLSAKGVSPGGGGAGSGGAAAMYQLIDVSPNDTKDAVLGAEKDYVLTFDGSFWRGMPNKGGLSSKLFTALDKEGNEVNPDDENAEIYAIRANYSLWSVGFLSAKGISDGGTGGGGGGAVALYQLLDVEKNADITGVAGATKGSVLTFNGDKWYADKPKTAAGISNLFTALDNDGNEVDLNDESKLGTITNIRANYALWSVDWISAKGKSSGGSGGGGGLINLVYGFESLGGTFDNNDNSATFNAFTINEIWKLASSGLTNVTVTGSGNAVTDVTKGSDGRSLTFTKGSTFATKSEFDALNTKFNDFLTGSDADDIINKWSELEVFLQGMKESDNLAVILQSKMDKTAFSKLFTALDASGNEVDPSDDTKTIASIRANFGFWGVDYISAKGVSKGSGGTGGASTLYQLVDVLANDTEDGVEGAAAGKALVFDGTHWRAGDAGLNESQLYSYLTANKYLTQSAADSRYVTSSRKVIAGTGLSGGGALTSDVTLSLGTSGVVAGTYTKVMVDAYGRVTSGTNLSATDIPNLDWSKITTGKPTTLAGYGITDAVTLTTAQTISGRKTFSQNIVFNNNGGITYTDSNVVLRNSDGHTILASFGNGEINLRPNGHNNTEGAVWINKKGNVQAPSVSTNTITIGDAQLVYDSKNKALRVKHRTDGNTVGFYSDGWITALGVQTGGAGGGSGVIKTVYSFANLTDGTTFSDSDLNNTFNAYTVKEIWKMAKEGGGIKNIAQSGSGNAITDMTLSSDGKTITAVFGETFARQQDLGTLNNTVTQLSNKLNNFLEGLTGNDTLTELLALKADKTITISAGTGLTGGGNLSANRTLSLATTGVKAGTYTKVTVDTYGRVTVGDNPTTLAGYGITDAYTKTEADGKYVTIATPQTITGQKTFTKNIAMNSGIGLSYSGNTVFRNTSGNTVISSYGDSGMLYFRPNGDTSDVGVVQINKQGHINGVSAGFKGGVSAARLSATEYVQIGDAYLKWDAANNAVYVIKKDGTTPVGFYSTDWLSAKGVSMSGAQTGTLDSLNDVEITDPVNGQALKYDAASKKWVNGTIDSFNVNQMWAELKKADSSKVIDASHIPTSVLDGRWVKKAGDTMTGTLTSASSSGSIVFKGVENCDITNIYKDNGVIRNDDGGLTSIRNGLRFNWYDTSALYPQYNSCPSTIPFTSTFIPGKFFVWSGM
jgi:phage-related tail fiber protein